MAEDQTNQTNADAANAEQAQTDAVNADQQAAQEAVAQAEQTEINNIVPDAGVPTLTQVANQGIDPSNTYEYGVAGAVNTAVPEGADVVTDLEGAQDAGYFGYSPGIKATEQLTLAEAGKRNERVRERQREGNRAVINRSATAENADPNAVAPGRARGQSRSAERRARNTERQAARGETQGDTE